MRGERREGLTSLARARGFSLALGLLIAACGGDTDASKVAVPGREGRVKSAAWVRAERRLYDGAPPVIPHADFGAACTSCHDERGVEVKDVGFAPPSPHERTAGLSSVSRCEQCHVQARTDARFVENSFAGIAQDLRHGERATAIAPPTIPHPTLMRENCAACHTGPAAREEVRCTHPERTRCSQCHVPESPVAPFARP